VMEFLDRRDRWKREIVPASVLTAQSEQFIKLLSDHGYIWPPNKCIRTQIIAALSIVKPDRDIRVTFVPGWCGKSFVLPDESYGATGPDRNGLLIVRHPTVRLGSFRRVGTLDDWKKHVAKKCVHSTRARLAMATTFAAPNLRRLGLNSFGFNFSGETSGGPKNSAGRSASGMMTAPRSKRMRTAKATKNTRAPDCSRSKGWLSRMELPGAHFTAARARAVADHWVSTWPVACSSSRKSSRCRSPGGADTAAATPAYVNEFCASSDGQAFMDTRPKPRPAPSGAPRAACRRPRRPARPREKLFGKGRPVPLDREAKCRLMTLVKALMHPTEPGKHWGQITAKAHDVFEALLWGFHNARNGLCFPSYQTIAAKARCAASTVAEAIKMLEAARILTWCNRRARVRIGGIVKVIRISNSYRFLDPGSKSELQSGTRNQDSSSLVKPAEIRPIDLESPLERGIALGKKAHGRA
jgi:hypothetical protein